MNVTKVFLLLLACYFSNCSYLPDPVELLDNISITETPDYINISNNVSSKDIGIIFYPGGLVDPHAYIQSYQSLVEDHNYQIVIIKASGNLAIFNTGKALEIQASFPEINNWVIGGHSLGGVVATKAIANSPKEFQALFLTGSYSIDDISAWEGVSISITAENDLLTEATTVDENAKNLATRLDIDELADLPVNGTNGNTIYYDIKGGNHAQFGNYGIQDGDGTASITAAEQQQKVCDLITAFLITNDLY